MGDPINGKDVVTLRYLTNSIHVASFTGGTITGNTNFVANLSGETFYSGSTPLTIVIENLISEYIYPTTGITDSFCFVNFYINYYGINYNGAVNITLPNSTGKDGYTINIKDEGGHAGTHTITLTPLSGLIDNNSSAIMNTNYKSLTLIARSGNWWLI